MVGSFNNWNIVTFSHKSITSEDFYDIHRVFLDDISDNMDSFVQCGKYGDMNTTDSKTMVYYVIKFFLEAYTLQEDIICDVQIIIDG